MSATLERYKLEDARDELKAAREEFRRAHLHEAPGILAWRVDALIEKLDKQCDEPISLNTRQLRVGWRRAELRGFKRGMLTMGSVWACVILLGMCPGGCFADTGTTSGGNDASGGTSESYVTSTGETVDTGTTGGAATNGGEETTGGAGTTGTHTSWDTSQSASTTETTGAGEHPYKPCPNGTCEDGSLCTPYVNMYSVCAPPCNPGACPPVEGWEVYCEGTVCRIACDEVTMCPDEMVCIGINGPDGKCFHPLP